jgi:hypothetical protein
MNSDRVVFLFTKDYELASTTANIGRTFKPRLSTTVVHQYKRMAKHAFHNDPIPLASMLTTHSVLNFRMKNLVLFTALLVWHVHTITFVLFEDNLLR